jgi:MIP family channel proteins
MFNLNGMQPAAVTNISLCFGLTITILVYSFAGISGANINPAVTLGLAITRKMSLFRAVCYILAQLLGATIGAAMARHVSPEIFDRYNGGVNFIGADVTVGGAFLAEFMGTFVLVFTVFCAIDTERGDEVFHMPTLAPLAIGLSVTLCHFGMIGIDNCSINPARSFGASAITGMYG